MRCTVVGQNLRILSKSVRLMSKYSDYVNISTKNNVLVLQAVNDSKSTFCEVIFRKDFFASCNFANKFECKVDIRSLGLVFRIINLDRMIESCKILMDPSFNRLIFEMECKYNVHREYSIPYMESEMQKCKRISETNSTPSIKAQAKLFAEIFKHFANSTIEATIWLFPDHTRFKTFIEIDDEHYFDLPCTSFSLLSTEFSAYNHTNDISCTFNVRDIKAFLDFAVYRNQMVSAYFQPIGKPLEFVFHNSNEYSSRIIMATVEFPESEQPEPPPFRRTTNIRNSQITTSAISQEMNQSSGQNESLNYQSSTNSNGNNVKKDSNSTTVIVEHNPEKMQQQSTHVPSDHQIGNDSTNVQDQLSQQQQPGCMASDFSEETDDNEPEGNINEEISNIVDILDHLPDFTTHENDDSDSMSELTGTQLSYLRQSKYQFTMGDCQSAGESDVIIIAPNSDDDNDEEAV